MSAKKKEESLGFLKKELALLREDQKQFVVFGERIVSIAETLNEKLDIVIDLATQETKPSKTEEILKHILETLQSQTRELENLTDRLNQLDEVFEASDHEAWNDADI